MPARPWGQSPRRIFGQTANPGHDRGGEASRVLFRVKARAEVIGGGTAGPRECTYGIVAISASAAEGTAVQMLRSELRGAGAVELRGLEATCTPVPPAISAPKV
jgi:hypothetical protein